MSDKREIILLGLGEFGKAVNDNIKNLLEERRRQLGEKLNEAALYYVNFENTNVFHSSDVTKKILDAIKDSSGKKNAKQFYYILIGDLYEEITSRFAIDFAYIPHILNRDGTVMFKSEIAFFTFSDEIGVAEKASDDSISLINNFFVRLQKINESNKYTPPFSDVGGKKHNDIELPNGPFARNYVLVTPGDSKSVAKETGTVFAERIFYEIFYLSTEFDNLIKGDTFAQVIDDENSSKNFSCFSMVQIPRINEIQKYYLRYTLESSIVKSFLEEETKGTDIEFYFEKFLQMLDISKNDEFPIERAVNLFIEQYKSNFRHLLSMYVSKKNYDFTEYIEECKNRLETCTSEMRPKYDDFAQAEFNYMFETLQKGLTSLFKINRLTGRINSYISFVEKLKEKFEAWENSLKQISAKAELYNIDEDFNEINKKIKKLQTSKLFAFLPLRPIRNRLIKNDILKLPIENYLDSLICKKLADSLSLHWQSLYKRQQHPIFVCENLIRDLNEMKRHLEEKNSHVDEKISFIENMNSYYYVIGMFDNDADYKNLLERIKAKNFGESRKTVVDQTVTNAFKKWTENKDYINIIHDPSGFIKFLESEYVPGVFETFSMIEEDINSFAKYAEAAVPAAKKRTHDLNFKSFNIENIGSYLTEQKIMLCPVRENADILAEKIDAEFNGVKSVDIPNDFSLGSVIYFNDYLFMGQKDLQKNILLEKYKDSKFSANEYNSELSEITNENVTEKIDSDSTEKIDNSDTEKAESDSAVEIESKNENADDDNDDVSEVENEYADDGISQNEFTKLQKYTYSLLFDYASAEELCDVYTQFFEKDAEYIAEEEVTELVKKISFEEALGLLSDEKLEEYAKDNNIPLKSDREKFEKLISHKIKEKAEV